MKTHHLGGAALQWSTELTSQSAFHRRHRSAAFPPVKSLKASAAAGLDRRTSAHWSGPSRVAAAQPGFEGEFGIAVSRNGAATQTLLPLLPIHGVLVTP